MATSRQVRTKRKGFDSECDRDKALEILSQLSEDLMSLSPTEFIERLPDKVCELLAVPICIIWQKVRKQPKFKIIAASKEVYSLKILAILLIGRNIYLEFRQTIQI